MWFCASACKSCESNVGSTNKGFLGLIGVNFLSLKPTPELDNFEGDTERWREALDAHLEEMQKDMIPIEMVLWRYCRNPIVHEGSTLAVGGDTSVTLDWSVPPNSLTLKVDQEAKNVIVISAPFLLNVLYQIVAKHLGGQLGT